MIATHSIDNERHSATNPHELVSFPCAAPAGKTDAISRKPQQPHIAVLTPAIKLEMVRSVRQRLADPSAWLPWKMGDKTAYAAKMDEGKTILVEVKNPEATRFSLIGAFLLEFHLRQVVHMAVGRGDLLDHEIPEAVRRVLTGAMTNEEREHAEQAPVEQNLARLTHVQCLAVLALLEETYSKRVTQARGEAAKRLLGNVRLPDLVHKLEEKAPIEPSEVATALYHEVAELSRRLDRLESQIACDPSV